MKSRLSRRQFVAATALAVSAGTKIATAADSASRQFTMDLRCGSIGVKADQRKAIALASQYGFESVNPDPGYLARLGASQRTELTAELHEKNLKWGAGGLSVDFRSDDAAFREGLKRLPAEARALQDVEATRVGTWIRPYDEHLTYVQNFRQHATRLRACCRILGDHGLRFGMEYVGPKTLWSSKLHSFVHTMAETKDLIAEINLDNVGVVLDSWHWYTANETMDDLKSLKNNDIVACDLNDAPAGIPIDEQIDNRRELPMATGVIDMNGFLNTLVTIGYDGPIRAEPFNAALNKMDEGAAVKATAVAMRKAFALTSG
jgi:sugar phosphate isomerase/epimerase